MEDLESNFTTAFSKFYSILQTEVHPLEMEIYDLKSKIAVFTEKNELTLKDGFDLKNFQSQLISKSEHLKNLIQEQVRPIEEILIKMLPENKQICFSTTEFGEVIVQVNQNNKGVFELTFRLRRDELQA